MKIQSSILVIDDDQAVLTTARLFLKQKFEFVQTIDNPALFDDVMRSSPFDLILLDMNYTKGESDGQEGLQMITHILTNYPNVDIIAVTAYGEVDLAVETLKRGARDFLTKPWNNTRLLRTIERLLDLDTQPDQIEPDATNKPGMVGESLLFDQMVTTIDKVAPTDANVLILGENGSGKELVAKSIHDKSDRSAAPFIKIDLGSLVESIFESELFGHKKGAFTDAVEDRVGKLELADRGTLFLDEIGNISLTQQAKLLTVLEQRSFTRVGENQPRNIDVRIVSATNANLSELINHGLFRQDFLYRINTVEILVPSLSERSDDIPLLTKHFLKIYKKKYHKPQLKINEEAIKMLQTHSWPGNIRELSHVIERSVIMTTSQHITPADVQLTGKIGEEEEENLNLDAMEKRLILKSLKKNKGNITHAAKDLGIDRQVLYRRLEKHGL